MLQVHKWFDQWENNIQLVSDNCVELITVLYTLVLGYAMIFYVEEPLTFYNSCEHHRAKHGLIVGIYRCRRNRPTHVHVSESLGCLYIDSF